MRAAAACALSNLRERNVLRRERGTRRTNGGTFLAGRQACDQHAARHTCERRAVVVELVCRPFAFWQPTAQGSGAHACILGKTEQRGVPPGPSGIMVHRHGAAPGLFPCRRWTHRELSPRGCPPTPPEGPMKATPADGRPQAQDSGTHRNRHAQTQSPGGRRRRLAIWTVWSVSTAQARDRNLPHPASLFSRELRLRPRSGEKRLEGQ